MFDKQKYAEALDGSSIAEERAKILPDMGDEKIRLEVGKIKEVLTEENLEYDRIENSAEAFDALSSLKGGQGVKKFLNALFRAHSLMYNPRQLNKIEKADCLKLFFSVFDVFPKSDDEPDLSKLNQADQSSSDQPTVDQNPIEPPTIDQPSIDQNPIEPPSDDDVCEISFEQMQTIFNRSDFVTCKDIDAADDRTIYKNMPVTLKDGFLIHNPNKIPIFDGCVIITNSQNNNPAAIGRIELGEFRADDGAVEYLPHMVFDDEKIDYEQFKHQSHFNIVLVPADQKKHLIGTMTPERAANTRLKFYLLKGYSFQYGELETTNRTLCIDFGTSNTTVGTYGLDPKKGDKDINLVTFLDVTAENPINREMLPTMMYVQSCNQNEEPVYKFGYEAKKKLIDAHYDTKASVFFELKRWINSMDAPEQINDEDGNKSHVTRKSIIQKYLRHVVKLAEQQFKVHFKRLHFTAPVKLKENFLFRVREMFPEPEYHVMDSSESIDEGMAVVYNHISNQMKTRAEHSGKIMIFDCGGGTTDLADCLYSYRDSPIGKLLSIETQFKNGDSNYGGNNITYRILQMIKIKLAHRFMNGSNLRMTELITSDEDSVLKMIDDDYYSKEKIYAAFEQKYAEAEKYIPTQFERATMKEEKRRVRRNFYYLWQMAEAIKIEFYKSNIVNVDFNKNEDRRICIVSDAQYYLSVRPGGSGALERRDHPLDEIEITYKEIDLLIEPDIYALLNSMLRLYETNSNSAEIKKRLNELQEYVYRLSGQSCKVALFPELLKEFIPGKILRRGKGKKMDQRASDELKKYCIEGSIEYIRDRETGNIQPQINLTVPSLIYTVRSEERNKVLLKPASSDEEEVIDLLALPNTASEHTFVISDEKGAEKNRITYKFKPTVQLTPEQLVEYIESKTYYSEEQTDKIADKLSKVDPRQPEYGERESVNCLFVLPSREGYGMRIYQICIVKKNDAKQYFAPRDAEFVDYENEQLQTFFDGKK